MKTYRTGPIHMAAIALLIAGIGAAGAQTVPRDRPDPQAAGAAKPAAVEQWSKRRGARVIWSQDTQQLPKATVAESASRVDAEKVEAVNQQSKERGHRQVWVKYPDQRRHATSASAKTTKAAAATQSGATQTR